jgi:Flp pilus assembly protein TadG
MLARFSSLLADKAGVAVTELALVAPVLAVMTIGIVDISNAYSRKLALEQGAQRAIEKIMQTTANDTVEGTLASEAVCQVNGMNSDGTCKTSPITTSNVTVSWRRECTTAGSFTTTAAGTTTPATYTAATDYDNDPCNSNAAEADYIQIYITDKYTPLFATHFGSSYNSAEGAYDISASAGMRIK